jgi:hypothetical protein
VKFLITRGIDIIQGINRLSIGPGKFESSEPWIVAALANYPGVTPEPPESAASVPTPVPVKVAPVRPVAATPATPYPKPAPTTAEAVDPEAEGHARIDALFDKIFGKDSENDAS